MFFFPFSLFLVFVKLRVHSLDATDDAGRQQAATPAAKPASTQGPEQQKKTSQSQLKKGPSVKQTHIRPTQTQEIHSLSSSNTKKTRSNQKNRNRNRPRSSRTGCRSTTWKTLSPAAVLVRRKRPSCTKLKRLRPILSMARISASSVAPCSPTDAARRI